MPDKAVFDETFWVAYRRINELFARETIRALEEKLASDPDTDNIPIVWIHDYHLMLAATTIRQIAEEKDILCKIGFFLHIPFPPWDMVKIFPWHDLILQGILGCDLVGFHIEDYCINFIDSCARGLGCRVDRVGKLVEHGGRTVRVRPLPISIPYERFHQMAQEAPESQFSGLKVVPYLFYLFLISKEKFRSFSGLTGRTTRRDLQTDSRHSRDSCLTILSSSAR